MTFFQKEPPPNATFPQELRPFGSPMELTHRQLPAFIASLLVHLCLLVSLGLWWVVPQQGTGDEPDRDIGIAIVHRQKDHTRYVDAAELANEVSQKSQAAGDPSDSPLAAPPSDLAPPLDLAGLLQSMQSTPSPVASSGLAGDVAVSGAAIGGDGGSDTQTKLNETTTMVFGVSGSGSRFVYVFDRSDSMNSASGRPLRAAKRELIRSLKSLGERQQFQVIFYNDKPTPFQLSGVPLQLYRGELDTIQRAVSYVDSVAAFGGTEHDSALKLALRMSPDVIFFLTDARIPRLSGSELFEIQRRADSIGTTIHAIEFGTDPAAPSVSFLRELASMNGGQYQYVNTHRLDSSAAGDE
jgi:hypothetical protein